jgi:hypothetical protein
MSADITLKRIKLNDEVKKQVPRLKARKEKGNRISAAACLQG